MRLLGDDYVQSEWRRYKTISDSKYLDPFFQEWRTYADHLGKTTSPVTDGKNQGNGAVLGKKLEKEKLDKFSKEQLGQLYVLK